MDRQDMNAGMLTSQALLASTSKRKRGPNWSDKEKEVLVEAYRRHRHVLRPRAGVGGSTLLERDTAWETICDALRETSGPGIKRDVVDVRKKWDNMCFWAKKCIAEWKDRNCNEGELKDMSGDMPPSLALKILAIYQEEWADIFPNAQVVDGGDVFFVFNQNNQANGKEQVKPSEGAIFTNNVGDPVSGDEDVYEVTSNGQTADQVHEIKDEMTEGWEAEREEGNHGYSETPQDTSSQDGPIQDAEQLSDIHLYQQQQHPLQHFNSQRAPFDHSVSSQSSTLDKSSLSKPPSLPSVMASSTHSLTSATTVAATPHRHQNRGAVARFYPYRSYAPEHSTQPSTLPHPAHSGARINHHHPPRGSPPPFKRARSYSQAAAQDSIHSDLDDDKDIERLSKDLLVLRKEKLLLEKQKLEIEKEKLVIERDILDMQREREWMQLEQQRLANGQGQ